MRLRLSAIVFFILYALLTFYPLVLIGFGIASPPGLTIITTLAGFTFALLHAGQREGWKGALRLLALVFGVSSASGRRIRNPVGVRE